MARLPPSGRDARTEALRAAFDALKSGAFGRAAGLAEPLYRAQPDLQSTLLLGLALGGSGQPDRAAALLNEAARQRPDSPHPAQDLVQLLRDAGQAGAIDAYFSAAQTLASDDPRLSLALGEWLKTNGQPEAARDAFARAVSLRPDFAAAQVRLALSYAEAGGLDDATALLRQVLARDPARLDALTNLGVMLSTQGRFAEAFAPFEQARRLAPDRADIQMNHGHALLKAGRLREGWAPFNQRLEQPGRALLPARLLLPPLEPGHRLDGKTVVVTYDSGFGDTLQFARYLPWLAAAGAQVLLWVPEPLRRLLAAMPGVASVLSGNVTLPRFDWHCPIIQLAQAFGTDLATIPGDVPYLTPDPALVAAWAARLPAARAHERRIGLVWAGAPKTEFDRRRSMALAAMAPLADVTGVRWISLQMGEARNQTPPAGLALHDPMGAVQDFADTAAIIASLDAVVSVDTAVVHLAGAMGKPVILLDRYDNCWRWMTQREDSPWYPSIRIIRQTRWGDWGTVVRRAAEIIARLASSLR